MSTIGEDELQAYVDGELEAVDIARVEAAIEADPIVAAQVERERRLRAQLRAAFDPVLDEPVPKRLAMLLHANGELAGVRMHDETRVDATHGEDASTNTADNVVPLRTRGERPARPRWHTPVYALAASLAVLAVSLWLRPAGGPVQMQGGELVARGELARGLDTALASEPGGDAALAIGLSFRDGEGHVCRSFVQRAESSLAGLACREGDRWTLPVLSRASDSGGAELRQASSGIPPEVQAAIDERVQGDAFDAEAERAARDAGWR
jgi:hypothetical protein